jgi:hypothetical protein
MEQPGNRPRPADPPLGIAMPGGQGSHPGVVIGAEAYGVNPFVQGVQQRLVGLGYAAAVVRHAEADRAAWDDAVAFLRAHTED